MPRSSASFGANSMSGPVSVSQYGLDVRGVVVFSYNPANSQFKLQDNRFYCH